MTPYQISSEIYGGFYYPGITLSKLVGVKWCDIQGYKKA